MGFFSHRTKPPVAPPSPVNFSPSDGLPPFLSRYLSLFHSFSLGSPSDIVRRRRDLPAPPRAVVSSPPNGTFLSTISPSQIFSLSLTVCLPLCFFPPSSATTVSATISCPEEPAAMP
ncbi:hypothetical protein F2P56_011765 [Juglans regia]|uniref:Uncharacterized protein n=1 Tax=Juglans regia TaxID=51240 RepID=A0A833XUG8_JUGRE|nr:hypothetical protein F2P56_011765 [Juglans regia]